MKLFLSDLHLGDGKERDDFQYHEEFDTLVEDLCERFEEVEIVFLGDIFDLIRTRKYYELEKEPFTEKKLISVKRLVMADILENHVRFFETLRRFVRRRGHRFRYIVGNHDFGFVVDPRLSELIQEKYGLRFFPRRYYRDEDLKIWAEHGHRYDIVNNTFGKDGTPIPYCLGDKIVIEIVNKFFEKVRKKDDELGIDLGTLNDLDNVRPQTAIPKWLRSVDEEGRLNQIFWETVLAFGSTHPFELGSLVLELIQGNYEPDLLRAAKELAQKRVGRYVIFGHTHHPVRKSLAKGARYLNTGTWRRFIEPEEKASIERRIVPTYREGGTQFFGEEAFYRYHFVSTTHLSYVLFYEKGEGKVGPRLIIQE